MRDFVQHDAENLLETTKLFAVLAGLRAKVQLDVCGGGIGIIASIGGAASDPLTRRRLDETLDSPASVSQNGVDMTGNPSQ